MAKIKLGVGGGGVAVNTAPGEAMSSFSWDLIRHLCFSSLLMFTPPPVSFLHQPLCPALLHLDIFNQAAIFAACAKYTLFKCIKLELLRVLALPEIEQV